MEGKRNVKAPGVIGALGDDEGAADVVNVVQGRDLAVELIILQGIPYSQVQHFLHRHPEQRPC